MGLFLTVNNGSKRFATRQLQNILFITCQRNSSVELHLLDKGSLPHRT